MIMHRLILYIVLCLLPFSYGGNNSKHSEITAIPDLTVEEGSDALNIQNGVSYFSNVPVSGYIISHYNNSALKEKNGYINGIQEGTSLSWFENGTMNSKRFYVNGEKDGTHYGWYSDGSKRFEYNFTNGVNTGIHYEWYQNGSIAKKTVYKNGIEEQVQAWRDNGKLYINYVVNNSHLCYTLKNEKGEYVKK